MVSKTLLVLSSFLIAHSAFANKSMLTSIGEICETSGRCKIEMVKKSMPIKINNRSLIVLDSEYRHVSGACKSNVPCKIVIKKL